MHKSNTKKTALYGMLIALAFILSYIENLIPVPIPIPGIKLGLANIVVLIGLYALGAGAAFTLSVVRVLLVSLTFGNMSMFWFSIAGAFLSFITMVCLKRIKGFSMIGVSIAGGVAHNIGQISVAMYVLGKLIIYQLPYLILGGIGMGTVIGIVGAIVWKKLSRAMNQW